MTDVPMVMVDLIDQTEIWVDARGNTHQVERMPEVYLRRVVAYLEESASEIVFAQGIKESFKMDGADLPPDVFDDWLDQQQRRTTDPVGWLRATPLFVRFRELLARTDGGAPW